MATTGRSIDPDVEQHGALRDLLASEPFRVQFFQAVRLLERIAPDRSPVGRFVTPRSEAVRFVGHPVLTFPASEIHSIELKEHAPPTMIVNFMGLTGPEGVLPRCYTEYLMERLMDRDTALRDFLDLFNHRAVSLLYRAWQKYRFTITYERGERDLVSHMLMCLVGLETPGLQNRQEVPDESLVYYAGLLSHHPRCAAGLEQILADYFDVPVEVEQFAGTWRRLEATNQTRFGEMTTVSEMLGIGVVVGDEVWDQQSMARIRIGPLPLARYLEFLPDGSAYAPLCSLVRFYFNDELDFELQLILKEDEVPRCELGAVTDAAPRLGWVAWMKSKPLGRSPDETIIQL